MPELRVAIRTLLRAPGFALLACLSLAIGIGANAAIYTVFDAVALRPFTHVDAPSALVLVVSDSMSHAEYEDVRAGAQAFERVAAFATREVALSGEPLAALALAAVGIYGVTAYAVVRRTREIGIRVALGAARADVLRLVLRGTFAPVAVGAGAGLASAMVLAKLLAGFLPGVSLLDPIAFAATTAIAVMLAVVASITPTRRALARDPVQALRNE